MAKLLSLFTKDLGNNSIEETQAMAPKPSNFLHSKNGKISNKQA